MIEQTLKQYDLKPNNSIVVNGLVQRCTDLSKSSHNADGWYIVHNNADNQVIQLGSWQHSIENSVVLPNTTATAPLASITSKPVLDWKFGVHTMPKEGQYY